MSSSSVTLRPMTEADVRPAQLMTIRAFAGLLEATQDPAWLGQPSPTEESLVAGELRYRCFIERDPGGAWVAEAEGEVVGVSLSLLREELWGLSLLTVEPRFQSSGVGSGLLRKGLEYGAAAKRGIIMSSSDPRALRAYTRSGYDLYPELVAYGPVRHDRLPAVTGVRNGDLSDMDLCERVSRHVRGSAHSAEDLGVLLTLGSTLFVTDDPRGTGYVVAKDGEVALLAATTDDAATRLLATALAITPEGKAARVVSMTSLQQWAIRLVLECGMKLSHVTGGVLTRGEIGPMTPYLPNGAFL